MENRCHLVQEWYSLPSLFSFAFLFNLLHCCFFPLWVQLPVLTLAIKRDSWFLLVNAPCSRIYSLEYLSYILQSQLDTENTALWLLWVWVNGWLLSLCVDCSSLTCIVSLQWSVLHFATLVESCSLTVKPKACSGLNIVCLLLTEYVYFCCKNYYFSIFCTPGYM